MAALAAITVMLVLVLVSVGDESGVVTASGVIVPAAVSQDADEVQPWTTERPADPTSGSGSPAFHHLALNGHRVHAAGPITFLLVLLATVLLTRRSSWTSIRIHSTPWRRGGATLVDTARGPPVGVTS